MLKGALHLYFELLLGTRIASCLLVSSQWLLLLVLLRYCAVHLGIESPLFLNIRKRLALDIVIHDRGSLLLFRNELLSVKRV